jgi:exonuclease SbcD
MRILHTADWHLNDRLGRIGRQDDIVARLEEIAGYLDEHQVDVMVVVGDLFSQHTNVEKLKDAVGEVNRIFKPFLTRGGTIVAISGNHDNEALFNLLWFALDLAHPLDPRETGPRPRGRLYLATRPTHLLLEDATGQQVQFLLMPYPTPARYLRGEATRYSSLEEKNRLMHQALRRQLRSIEERYIVKELPSVLVSHIHVRGSQVHNLYRITELEDVVFDPADIPTHWQYVAYGHIHKPQTLSGADHVRYAGSIERFDHGERDDEKSVTLVEIGPTGRVGEPVTLPLNATPIHRVEIDNPDEDLLQLKERYPDHERALVSYQLHYDPTRHNRDEICREIESIFPHWYERKFVLEGSGGTLDGMGPEIQTRDIPSTVREYLRENIPADREDRELVLSLADELLAEEAVR